MFNRKNNYVYMSIRNSIFLNNFFLIPNKPQTLNNIFTTIKEYNKLLTLRYYLFNG